MLRQMTATVYILEDHRVLLIYHRKLKKWLPPGGHLDAGELPPDGAIREAKEETGLNIELILQENIWITPRWNGQSFARPYMCLLEHIPKHGDHEAHEHIDFIYVGRPCGGTLIHNREECDDIRWFSIDQLKRLEKETEIFEETYETICSLYQFSEINS